MANDEDRSLVDINSNFHLLIRISQDSIESKADNVKLIIQLITNFRVTIYQFSSPNPFVLVKGVSSLFRCSFFFSFHEIHVKNRSFEIEIWRSTIKRNETTVREGRGVRGEGGG